MFPHVSQSTLVQYLLPDQLLTRNTSICRKTGQSAQELGCFNPKWLTTRKDERKRATATDRNIYEHKVTTSFLFL